MQTIKASNSQTLPRYIPHMLGSIFILMAFDHALHAYCKNFGRFWFFKDYNRDITFDYFYLIDQSIIMPILFFCMGTILAFHTRTLSSKQILKKIAYNNIVPFIFGITFIVPLLVFPRYSEYQDPNINLLEFYQTLYIDRLMQAGPFWVMYALTLYSAITWGFLKIFPKTLKNIYCYLKQKKSHIVFFVISFLMLNFIVLLTSDLMWGAPWWTGFGKLFYLQGSRFTSNFLFFFVGALTFKTQQNLKISQHSAWIIILLILISLFGYFYTDICINYEAYPPFIKVLMRQGENLSQALQQINLTLDIVLQRIAYLTLLIASLFLLILTVFQHKKRFGKIWQSLSTCCWGIFILHESITVWLQFWLVDHAIDLTLKVIVVFTVSVSIAWILTALLCKINFLKKIFILTSKTNY